MRLPSKADDEEALPYPIETIRYWYVSPFGGRSGELAVDEVGVNRDALEQNTDLRPTDRVTVGVVGTNTDRPWFFQHPYKVIALDDGKPSARVLSPMGEVVLPPEQRYDFVKRPTFQPQLGDAVVLKGAAARRLGDPATWITEVLEKTARRPAP